MLLRRRLCEVRVILVYWIYAILILVFSMTGTYGYMGATMGTPLQTCDDGKTNLIVDWDYSFTAYSCMGGSKWKPSLDKSPVYYNIPNFNARKDQVWHYCMNTSILYKDRPPIRGHHRPLWAKYGEYLYVPPHRWLHNLEHGSIVMLYHPCADEDQVNKLRQLVTSCIWRHVITPYDKLSNDRPLALVAWGAKLEMNTVDVIQSILFMRKHARVAPEDLSKEGQYDQMLLKAASLVSDREDSVVCPWVPTTNINAIKAQQAGQLSRNMFFATALNNKHFGKATAHRQIHYQQITKPISGRWVFQKEHLPFLFQRWQAENSSVLERNRRTFVDVMNLAEKYNGPKFVPDVLPPSAILQMYEQPNYVVAGSFLGNSPLHPNTITQSTGGPGPPGWVLNSVAPQSWLSNAPGPPDWLSGQQQPGIPPMPGPPLPPAMGPPLMPGPPLPSAVGPPLPNGLPFPPGDNPFPQNLLGNDAFLNSLPPGSNPSQLVEAMAMLMMQQDAQNPELVNSAPPPPFLQPPKPPFPEANFLETGNEGLMPPNSAFLQQIPGQTNSQFPQLQQFPPLLSSSHSPRPQTFAEGNVVNEGVFPQNLIPQQFPPAQSQLLPTSAFPENFLSPAEGIYSQEKFPPELFQGSAAPSHGTFISNDQLMSQLQKSALPQQTFQIPQQFPEMQNPQFLQMQNQQQIAPPPQLQQQWPQMQNELAQMPQQQAPIPNQLPQMINDQRPQMPNQLLQMPNQPLQVPNQHNQMPNQQMPQIPQEMLNQQMFQMQNQLPQLPKMQNQSPQQNQPPQIQSQLFSQMPHMQQQPPPMQNSPHQPPNQQPSPMQLQQQLHQLQNQQLQQMQDQQRQMQEQQRLQQMQDQQRQMQEQQRLQQMQNQQQQMNNQRLQEQQLQQQMIQKQNQMHQMQDLQMQQLQKQHLLQMQNQAQMQNQGQMQNQAQIQGKHQQTPHQGQHQQPPQIQQLLQTQQLPKQQQHAQMHNQQISPMQLQQQATHQQQQQIPPPRYPQNQLQLQNKNNDFMGSKNAPFSNSQMHGNKQINPALLQELLLAKNKVGSNQQQQNGPQLNFSSNQQLQTLVAALKGGNGNRTGLRLKALSRWSKRAPFLSYAHRHTLASSETVTSWMQFLIDSL